MLTRRNISRQFQRIHIKIKRFLSSHAAREFLIFLFFFFVAGGFWLLYTLNNEYEATYKVPVRLKDVPENVVITSDIPSEVEVTVKDKGTVLVNYLMGKTFLPVSLPFSDLSTRGPQVKLPMADYAKKITAQLNLSTKLVRISPDTLSLVYSSGFSKKVPVRIGGTLAAGRQYYLSDTIVKPDSVLVYAPRKLLDKISEATTTYFAETDISDTLHRTYSLVPVKGAKFVPENVNMTFLVDVYTEKTVEVPLVGIHLPTGSVLRTFPSRVQVTFQVGQADYQDITSESFSAFVSYKDLKKLGNAKYPVHLTRMPSGIKQVRVSPANVDFLIEQIDDAH